MKNIIWNNKFIISIAFLHILLCLIDYYIICDIIILFSLIVYKLKPNKILPYIIFASVWVYPIDFGGCTPVIYPRLIIFYRIFEMIVKELKKPGVRFSGVIGYFFIAVFVYLIVYLLYLGYKSYKNKKINLM